MRAVMFQVAKVEIRQPFYINKNSYGANAMCGVKKRTIFSKSAISSTNEGDQIHLNIVAVSTP